MTASAYKKVNLFIIGAPKAGTTSLYYYLGQHADIQMPRIKEPHYFSKDFPNYSNITTLEEYHHLFNWEDNAKYYGDASVWYLYSEEAVDHILAYNPEAKFIVMLRDPVELLPSLHNQLKLTLMEDIEEFHEAWNAMPERAAGKRIPKTCREPKLLLYNKIAKFGDQLERLLAKVDKLNLKVIQFDRFKKDPQKIVQETLDFLELPASINNMDFNIQNERSQIRYSLLNRALFEVSKHLNPFIKRSKKKLGIKQFGLLAPIRNRNKIKAKKATISPELAHEISVELKSDQQKLKMLL